MNRPLYWGACILIQLLIIGGAFIFYSQHHEPVVPDESVVQNEPVVPDESVVQTPVTTYTGPLTFHKELLETNPVEALRKQTEERGHWSLKWLPKCPPEDTEAAALARNEYLKIYYKSIGETDTPQYHQLISESISMRRDRMKRKRQKFTRRSVELSRLTWVSADENTTAPELYLPLILPIADNNK